MIYLGIAAFVVWWLLRWANRFPIPHDVRVDAPGGLIHVSLKSDTRPWYQRDYEVLYANSRLFIGLRAAWVARRIRLRRELKNSE